MTIKKIKIGYQKQANKEIFLLNSGIVECGNFKYNGRFKNKFKDIYKKIINRPNIEPENGILDISNYKYWNAIAIYDEFVATKWFESISAQKIEELAIETDIYFSIQEIRIEFKRAVDLKFNKIYKKSDMDDPNTPHFGWKIF